MRTEQKVFNNLIETIVRNSENNIATIADVKLWAETWQKEMELELTLTDVGNCVYVVTERDNYGEQLFKGVFSNREKAVKYLAEDGLKESNIDEINEIELD